MKWRKRRPDKACDRSPRKRTVRYVEEAGGTRLRVAQHRQAGWFRRRSREFMHNTGWPDQKKVKRWPKKSEEIKGGVIVRQTSWIGLSFIFTSMFVSYSFIWEGEIREVHAAANPQQGTIERIERPPGSSQPHRYSQLVRAGNTLYIAGQSPRNAKGEIVGKGDMGAQVRQVYENLKNVLASQGATLDNLVKITIFTLSIEEWRMTGDIREEYLVGRAPASTLVQIDQLASPDFLVEIEAIAVVDQ
jgi:2-iminobutanoate/2-iminopropanoate deaminase